MKKYIMLFSILMIYASLVFGQSVSIPSITASTGDVTVPLNVSNFNNIGSVTFYVQYNRSVLTFIDVLNKPSTGTFVADTADGIVSILWYSTSGVNFNSKFVDLKFSYKGGSSDLKFVSTFEVTDPDGNLISVTHSDGGVYGQVPTISIGTVQGTAGNEVTVPVTAEKLSNVGAISLKINYDPNVLTYKGAANVLASPNITVTNLNGVITISKYSGSAINAESAKLCDLQFTYNNGSSDLAFDKANCEIADNSGNVIPITLKDGKVSGEMSTITIGSISNAVAGGSVSVPVNATKLTNVGAISLKLTYDQSVLEFLGTENVLTGSDIEVNANNGTITIGKYSGNAISVASAKLCDLKFKYISGSSNLSFVTADCELADNNGNVISASFADGKVSSGSTSQTSVTIGTISASAGTAVSVPINAANLSNVGAISLKITYDANALTFTGSSNVMANSGISVDNQNGIITIGKYSGNAITAASTKLCDLNFNYTNGNSALSFVTADCELADNDGNPISVKYTNGAVNNGNTAEIKIAAKQAVSGASVSVPVTATKLASVGAISLKIQYDSNVLTFTGSENILANSDIAVENNNGVITISKYSGKNITTASATLCNLVFTYKSGVGNLTFVKADCELADSNGTVISANFVDGKVVSATNTKISLPVTYMKAEGSVGTDVTIPVKVENFTKIGSISLKIEYDPSVLTYKNSTNPANSSISVIDASGVLTVGWYGTSPINITSGQLVNLKFRYKGENTPLTFDKTQCEISDSTGTVLYVEYTDGKVALNQAPYFTKTLNDQSVTAGKALRFNYAATDPDGSKLTYSLENAPAGATIIQGTGAFSWIPTEEQAKKSYKIVAVVSDGIDAVKDTASIGIISDVETSFQGTPTQFALYQNNPNPFNPSTRIQYALPKASQVSLKVYNLLGQEVATLVNEFQATGYHAVEFNATNLTTGLYLYRLDAENFVAIKKMMLVK